MRRTSDFHQLMRELLQILKIQTVSREEPGVYSFKCDGKVEIHFFSEHRDSIDIMATVGMLKNTRSYETLQSLLAMNMCMRKDSRPFNIGMDPRTGTVTLWTKDYLDFLDVNKMVGVIREILSRAELIQKQLEEKNTSSGLPKLRGAAIPDAARKNTVVRMTSNSPQK